MMKTIRVLLSAVAAAAMICASPALAEDAVGKWAGKLTTQGRVRPVNVTIIKDAQGHLMGTAESPETLPGVQLSLTAITTDGNTLDFYVNEAGGEFHGAWDASRKSWIGTWSGNDRVEPMTLARAP